MTYDIEYSTNILFRNASIVTDKVYDPATDVQITGLDANKRYYVRIRQKLSYMQADETRVSVVGKWSKRAEVR